MTVAGRIPTDPEFYADRVADLRSLLSFVQDLDLWPPWDAVGDLVQAVGDVAAATVIPPEPDPEQVTSAPAGWRGIGVRSGSAAADLVRVPFQITSVAWEGASGDAFRSSVGELQTRIAGVRDACESVETTLDTLATEMTTIRERHRNGRDLILENLEISWSDLLPWEAYDLLTNRRGQVVDGIRETLGAYEDAGTEAAAADRAIRSAIDDIELPTTLPTVGGISPVDLLNGWDDDRGLLSGAALDRYEDRFGDLSPAERQRVADALANADSDAHRAAVLAGVGGGLSGAALARYLRQLGRMDRDEVEGLDPLTNASADITQPDQTTCGSSALVMARMLNDPAYAMWMRTGVDPGTGETDHRTFDQRFDDESEAMKATTNGPADRDGDLQQEWPESLGTPPWGAANEMSADGGSGVPGTEYGNEIVDPHDPGGTYDAIQRAREDGHAVPLYIGNEWSPRHVVLVTGTDGDDLSVYDPARGTSVTVTRDQFENGDLGGGLGWDQAWTAVLPQ